MYLKKIGFCVLMLIGGELLSEEVMIEGIVLVDDGSSLLDSEMLDQVDGLCIGEVSLPTSRKVLEKYLAPYYVGKPITQKQIGEIKRALYSYFEDHNDPFVFIYVPQQEMNKPVLQLVVTHSSLGNLNIEGSSYYSDRLYERYLGVEPGETIRPNEIQSGVSFMNRNPFRNVTAIYSRGKETGTTDLTLAVDDRFPLRLYAGADNTGIPTIQRQRFFQGVSWGKAFGWDHVASVQHTSTYDFHTFEAWTGDYQAFLPWKHLLRFYGGTSSIRETSTPLSMITGKNKGASGQASIRYTIPVTAFANTNIRQQFTIGFDYKNTNNTVLFSDIYDAYGKYVNISEFMLGYEWIQSFSSFKSQIDLELELFYSPGQLLPNQSNAAFQSLRPGAVNHWVYAKGYLEYLQHLPKDFSCIFWLRGQASSQNLLPNEQIGIGGYDTVRGYDERQYNSDDAVLFTAEVHSPHFPLFSNFFKKRTGDRIEFLLFVDYGYGWSHTPLPGEPKADTLLGVGPGLRYSAGPYISARLDYGVKLHHQAIFTGGASMVHFSAIVGY
jgi:hemolysin activation/secretion protein